MASNESAESRERCYDTNGYKIGNKTFMSHIEEKAKNCWQIENIPCGFGDNCVPEYPVKKKCFETANEAVRAFREWLDSQDPDRKVTLFNSDGQVVDWDTLEALPDEEEE